MSPVGQKAWKGILGSVNYKGPQGLGEFGIDSADSRNYMNWEIAAVRLRDIIKAIAMGAEGNSCGAEEPHPQRRQNNTS